MKKKTKPEHKLTIYDCSEHDHNAIFIDGKPVTCGSDYSTEYVYRIAKHLKWEVETITLTFDEFEKKFS